MKGFRYKHWLSGRKLPPQVGETELHILVERTAHGDEEAKTRLTEGHIRLAMGIVARYRRPDISDELVAAAFYGICKAVNYISEGNLTHDNPTGYIATFINGEIRKAIAGKMIPGDSNTQCYNLHDDRHVGGFPDTTMEVREQIEAISEDQTDLTIIRMKQLGYDGTEIARHLDTDRRRVSERLGRIRRKYKELENV